MRSILRGGNCLDKCRICRRIGGNGVGKSDGEVRLLPLLLRLALSKEVLVVRTFGILSLHYRSLPNPRWSAIAAADGADKVRLVA